MVQRRISEQVALLLQRKDEKHLSYNQDGEKRGEAGVGARGMLLAEGITNALQERHLTVVKGGGISKYSRGRVKSSCYIRMCSGKWEKKSMGAKATEMGSVPFAESPRPYLKTQSFSNKCHTCDNLAVSAISSLYQSCYFFIFLSINLISTQNILKENNIISVTIFF